LGLWEPAGEDSRQLTGVQVLVEEAGVAAGRSAEWWLPISPGIHSGKEQ
jgi:hypothetical protein